MVVARTRAAIILLKGIETADRRLRLQHSQSVFEIGFGNGDTALEGAPAPP
jgi:tRNA G46 methylase TrmB